MSEDLLAMDLNIMLNASKLKEAFYNTYNIGKPATMLITKRQIQTTMRLLEALSNAKLPSSPFKYDKSKVFDTAVAAVSGQWSKPSATGWTQIIACTIALFMAIGYYTDDGGDDDGGFHSRFQDLVDFARDETESLERTVNDREKRDAMVEGREAVLKTTADIGNHKKWSMICDWFFGTELRNPLLDLHRCFNDMRLSGASGGPLRTAAEAKALLKKIPKGPWDAQQSDMNARAKAILGGGRSQIDDEWEFGPVRSEEQGMPVNDHHVAAVPSAKRARGEEKVEKVDQVERDAKRNKFTMLRDAAVFATLAYGQALHSIEDAGPSEERNIASACSEIGWEVRNRLSLASPK